MSRFLKSYKVVLRTLGPVFIGNGREIGKKEYIRIDKNKVGVIDIEKLYAFMVNKRKQDQFESFLLKEKRDDIKSWMMKQNMSTDSVNDFVKYTLECGDFVTDKGAGNMHVMECVKDAYGNPYVPGSSLKGMLRTVLLANDILDNSGKYELDKKHINETLIKGGIRNTFLKNEMQEIESKSFRVLNREKTNSNDAVNDILQGVRVGDSQPLSTDDLVLCQKIDVHADKSERALPILKECIEPGTEIVFDVTIDQSVCKLTISEIENAIDVFYKAYAELFVNVFEKTDFPKNVCVLLGGGSGYISKTITYFLYEKKEGVRVTQQIFEKTNVPKQHKHYRDSEIGLSPHTLKCTKYQGKLMQMGLCSYLTATEY